MGNLIAAPLHGKGRRDGVTVFLDLSTMEPYDDQWAALSSLGRMSPGEVSRIARRAVQVVVGAAVDRLSAPVSTRIRATPPQILHARLAAGIRVELGELTPALHATLKHAASMSNPVFSERQRLRMSTWDTPRFLTQLRRNRRWRSCPAARPGRHGRPRWSTQAGSRARTD